MKTFEPSYRQSVVDLERALGDPDLAGNDISFASGWHADETETLPVHGLHLLDRLALRRRLVPRSLGGELATAEELLWLIRSVARRDMNVAVSVSTQIWSFVVWIGGNDEQRRDFAHDMLAGEVIPCLAYSEEQHGADFAANDCVATEGVDGTFLISGRKWPINRGSTSTHALVLARTAAVDNFQNQSLFLLDKRTVPADRVNGLPRTPTVGLRGCDISGIAFDRAPVPPAALIGTRGRGMETALRGLMLTRTLCSALSLGVGDTLLRKTYEHLVGRRLYARRAVDLPHVREALCHAYLNLLAAECVALVAMRGLHLFESEFSAWSSVVKVQVSRLVDSAGDELSALLGARHFFRDLAHAGIFQKMRRDGAVVSMFDGSSSVCLDSLAMQLPALERGTRRTRDEDWRQLYDLGQPLDPWEPGDVAVFGRGRDAVTASLTHLLDSLSSVRPDDENDARRVRALRTAGESLRGELDDVLAAIVAERPPRPTDGPAGIKDTPARLMRLAQRYSEVHTKVACLGIWLYNRHRLGVFFRRGAWLEAFLNRADTARGVLGDLAPETARDLFEHLDRQFHDRAYFSVISMPQAAAGSHGDLDS
ncbi:acyl-CoA dehydrogenase [Micromonospora sp. NBC_01699]|uniref:acyl-CoA dehydrogenase n=1 Tax=Micromonospora sp. NBC_01699 TaxID=2975984 RepID=UPI002E289C47|nr:acyl-CoA dehydrogenase [Micromonospora sp. NBC_01699]